jgi:hypothetical protein
LRNLKFDEVGVPSSAHFSNSHHSEVLMTHLNFFRKIPEYLATDLLTGKLTKDEYLVLTYMLLKCDNFTGVIVTNSNLLSNELDIDRKRVSNILYSLKRKKRSQNPDRGKTELRQKRGSTKPYPIYLCDHIPYSELDRGKTEARQRQDSLVDRAGVRRKNEKPSKPAPNQEESENGNFLASEIRSDLDIEEEEIARAREIRNEIKNLWPSRGYKDDDEKYVKQWVNIPFDKIHEAFVAAKRNKRPVKNLAWLDNRLNSPEAYKGEARNGREDIRPGETPGGYERGLGDHNKSGETRVGRRKWPTIK